MLFGKGLLLEQSFLFLKELEGSGNTKYKKVVLLVFWCFNPIKLKLQKKWLFCNEIACFLLGKILTCVINTLAYHVNFLKFYRIGSRLKIMDALNSFICLKTMGTLLESYWKTVKHNFFFQIAWINVFSALNYYLFYEWESLSHSFLNLVCWHWTNWINQTKQLN